MYLKYIFALVIAYAGVGICVINGSDFGLSLKSYFKILCFRF
jgi:hypothetical protein